MVAISALDDISYILITSTWAPVISTYFHKGVTYFWSD